MKRRPPALTLCAHLGLRVRNLRNRRCRRRERATAAAAGRQPSMPRPVGPPPILPPPPPDSAPVGPQRLLAPAVGPPPPPPPIGDTFTPSAVSATPSHVVIGREQNRILGTVYSDDL